MGIELMKLTPDHPDEILLEEFLKLMKFSQNRFSLDIRVPARRIDEIVHGKRRFAPDTALLLARYIDILVEFWLGSQMDYDLVVAEDESADRIRREVQVYGAR